MFDLSFHGQQVRFVGTAESPEWVAADIISVLYPNSNKSHRSTHLSKVKDKHKGDKRIVTPGGKQQMTTVFEPGLYTLIIRSNSDVATQFSDWIFEDVLPTIRKTGSYSLEMQPQQPALPSQEQQLKNIELGKKLLEELGGLDERTELALSDRIRDVLIGDVPALPGRREWPVSDRANYLGYNPSRGQLIKIGKTAKAMFVQKNGEQPPKREQYVDGTTRMVFCYSEADLDVLDAAIKLVMDPPQIGEAI